MLLVMNALASPNTAVLDTLVAHDPLLLLSLDANVPDPDIPDVLSDLTGDPLRRPTLRWMQEGALSGTGRVLASQGGHLVTEGRILGVDQVWLSSEDPSATVEAIGQRLMGDFEPLGLDCGEGCSGWLEVDDWEMASPTQAVLVIEREAAVHLVGVEGVEVSEASVLTDLPSQVGSVRVTPAVHALLAEDTDWGVLIRFTSLQRWAALTGTRQKEEAVASASGDVRRTLWYAGTSVVGEPLALLDPSWLELEDLCFRQGGESTQALGTLTEYGLAVRRGPERSVNLPAWNGPSPVARFTMTGDPAARIAAVPERDLTLAPDDVESIVQACGMACPLALIAQPWTTLALLAGSDDVPDRTGIVGVSAGLVLDDQGTPTVGVAMVSRTPLHRKQLEEVLREELSDRSADTPWTVTSAGSRTTVMGQGADPASLFGGPEAAPAGWVLHLGPWEDEQRFDGLDLPPLVTEGSTAHLRRDRGVVVLDMGDLPVPRVDVTPWSDRSDPEAQVCLREMQRHDPSKQMAYLAFEEAAPTLATALDAGLPIVMACAERFPDDELIQLQAGAFATIAGFVAQEQGDFQTAHPLLAQGCAAGHTLACRTQEGLPPKGPQALPVAPEALWGPSVATVWVSVVDGEVHRPAGRDELPAPHHPSHRLGLALDASQPLDDVAPLLREAMAKGWTTIELAILAGDQPQGLRLHLGDSPPQGWERPSVLVVEPQGWTFYSEAPLPGLSTTSPEDVQARLGTLARLEGDPRYAALAVQPRGATTQDLLNALWVVEGADADLEPATWIVP